MVLPHSILLCQTFQIFFAGQPYVISLLPRGTCHMCCEIVLEEDIVFMTHLASGGALRGGVRAADLGLDPRKPTVIYVHGFLEDAVAGGAGQSAMAIRDAYFSSGRAVNFVTMDWSRLCAFPWYSHAASNSPVAGRYLALFLDRLALDGVDPADVHVVGFSLGAQVAGFAGRQCSAGRPGRITGLDPALPLFHSSGPRGHLSANDALFVDVIHTDGGAASSPHAMGHADFFPNGGRAQPGCEAAQLAQQRGGSGGGGGNALPIGLSKVACNHKRAWEYYAESVRDPGGFPALRCASAAQYRSGRCREHVVREYAAGTLNGTEVVVMGFAAPFSCRGKYFLDTNSRSPFARGFPANLEQDFMRVDLDRERERADKENTGR